MSRAQAGGQRGDRRFSLSSESRPLLALLSLTLVTLAAAVVMGMLRLGVAGDSPSYLEASRKGLVGMLNDIRPIGYPLLLRAISWVSPHYTLLPAAQMALYVLVTFLLYAGLRRYGASGWQGFAVSAGFLVTLLNDPSVSALMTDSPARALSVAVVACLFWLAAGPSNGWGWAFFTFCLMASYLLRPGNAVLVGLSPILGWLLAALRPDSKRGGARRTGRFAVSLVFAAFLPLLGFCSLRLAVAGDFGICSFSGYQLSGMTVGLLDRATVEKVMPASMRPLGEALLEARDKKGVPCAIQQGRVNLEQWKHYFNIYAWGVAAPVGQSLYGKNPVLVNDKLKELSLWVLKRYSGLYKAFVLTNFWEDLGGLIQFNLVLQILLTMAFLAYVGRVVSERWKASLSGACPRSLPPGWGPKEAVRNSLWIAAVLLAMGNVVVTALAAVNLGRYSIAAGILLPSAAAEWAFREGRALIALWHPKSLLPQESSVAPDESTPRPESE